jgi:hypothetical protein
VKQSFRQPVGQLVLPVKAVPEEKSVLSTSSHRRSSLKTAEGVKGSATVRKLSNVISKVLVSHLRFKNPSVSNPIPKAVVNHLSDIVVIEALMNGWSSYDSNDVTKRVLAMILKENGVLAEIASLSGLVFTEEEISEATIPSTESSRESDESYFFEQKFEDESSASSETLEEGYNDSVILSYLIVY